jgi:nonribosomal peptide synthetase protein BlmX
VDRSSLPAPDITRGRDVGPVPPRTETEQIVAAVWGQVLGIADFGVDDDFFDLGGESLGAMHVVTKANKLFGLDLSVRTLFDLSTVASFARAVDEARSDDSRPAQLAAAAD